MLLALISLGLSWAVKAQDYGIISAKDVNLRRSANTSSELITKLEQYSLVRVLESKKTSEALGVKANPPEADTDCNAYFWHRIQYNGQEGWVYGAFLFTVNSDEQAREKFPLYSSSGLQGYLIESYRASDGGMMCLGTTLAFVFPENYKKAKAPKAQALSAEGLNDKLKFMGPMYDVFHAFLDGQNRLILAGGYKETLGDFKGLQVVEFTWNEAQQIWRGKQQFARDNR